MYRYIGLLQSTPVLSEGFLVDGNSSLKSVAQFYGLSTPAPEPRITLADYLARNCSGQPRIGAGTAWDRVELVIREMEAGTIRKVCIKILPLRERRGPFSADGSDRPLPGSKDRRRTEARDAWQ